MRPNLRSRLERLRETKPQCTKTLKTDLGSTIENRNQEQSPPLPPEALAQGWVPMSDLVARRSHRFPVPPSSYDKSLEAALQVLLREIGTWADEGAVFLKEDLVFFDLETTGLSGGAGTLAFLAAVGRFKGPALEVDQYLLLDYPGEADFIQALLETLGEGAPLVTYNGKSFDAQLFSIRCLMNGFRPPTFRHLDLLYPVRRLWGRRIPSCSLTEVERSVLRLDRGEDLGGAFAPEAWFEFLKKGTWDRVGRIADHNQRDILALVQILDVLHRIAVDPETAEETYPFDTEALAFSWRRFIHRAGTSPFLLSDSLLEEAGQRAAALLEQAVSRGYLWATLARAKDSLRNRDYDRARELLRWIAQHGETVEATKAPRRSSTRRVIQARSCGLLSIDAERRLGDRALALEWIERALNHGDFLPRRFREELERRKRRLQGPR